MKEDSNAFTTYVIYSKPHNKIYIGFTSDIRQRIIAHNHPKNKGWTKKYQPWVLIYSETFHSKSDALNRERALKSGQGREWIHAHLIDSLK